MTLDTPETMTEQQALFAYLLRLGDNAVVLSHRLGEWCGHAPVLEEDIALINVALDLLGQARSIMTYAGEVEGRGRDEDALVYRRDGLDYRNLLLVEQPNEQNFAVAIARQFLFDAWHYELQTALLQSRDARLAAIAAKSVKEVTYHLRHSSEWMIRLGDGTADSHARIQEALDDLWRYSGELFEADGVDEAIEAAGIGPHPQSLYPVWSRTVDRVLQEATLARPQDGWMQSGGRSGRHSEHLGYILAEMQFLQRAYPDARW
ncbi:1,2-phenylacetyl-CoA epoxidase subunit PaaC [Algihabitans albus]|uniref:1,2-phenylacetyl-CoA epoxidase subunit PaaC n=1 Tax=Algihabitans albus TaxID=2164067 RepID=UPI001F3E2846|nr:1,2-phenylacetyl-CoA epoxidase subunit PaaC [Algihabitans albus]